MNRSVIYTILFLICILTRLISSINYLEDYESALMAFDVKDPDLLHAFKSFHHPLFIVFVKFCAFFTNNIFIAFSLVGGCSLFLIIYYTLAILKTPLASLEGGLVSFLIFFNPVMWISSNRFTPELFGAAVGIMAFYYLISDHESSYRHTIGWFLSSLLVAVYPLYLFFLVLPLIFSLVNHRNVLASLAALLAGCLVWYIPVMVTGSTQMMFQELLSTVTPDPSIAFAEKFTMVGRSFWAAVLGGFWPGRSYFTLFTSLALVPCLFFGIMILLSFDYNKSKLLGAVLSFVMLFLAILFFKPYSHASFTLIIPFLMIIICYGIIYFLVNFNLLLVKGIILVFLISQIGIGIYYSIDHKKPTAVEQLRRFVYEKKRNYRIETNSAELNNYLSLQGLDASRPTNSPHFPATSQNVCLIELDPDDKILNKHSYFFKHSFVTNPKWSTLLLNDK